MKKERKEKKVNLQIYCLIANEEKKRGIAL